VPDVVAALLRAGHAPRAAGCALQDAGVGRLAAATGIEHGAVQQDGIGIGVDLDHHGIGRSGVGVDVAEVLAHRARIALRWGPAPRRA
jgi:hypothetical protein